VGLVARSDDASTVAALPGASGSASPAQAGRAWFLALMNNQPAQAPVCRHPTPGRAQGYISVPGPDDRVAASAVREGPSWRVVISINGEVAHPALRVVRENAAYFVCGFLPDK
jgi:hypothetical protein